MYQFFCSASIVCWNFQYKLTIFKNKKFENDKIIFNSSSTHFNISIVKIKSQPDEFHLNLTNKDKELFSFSFNELATVIKASKQFFITICIQHEPFIYLNERRLSFLKVVSDIEALIVQNKNCLSKSCIDLENIIHHYNTLACYKVFHTDF